MKKTTPKKQERIPTGSETILLIEDDAAVRQVTRSMLEEFGYSVLEAAEGIEAQEAFRRNRERIQLILCDLIMPKMNGRETFAAIQKIKSDVKVIFMSGYTSDIIAGKGVFYGRVGPEDAAADHPHQGGPGPGPDGGFLQA